MIKCTECGANRVVTVTADIPNGCRVEVSGVTHPYDEVPDDMGIGSGTTIAFEYCLGCGVISGDFPLDKTGVESEEESDD